MPICRWLTPGVLLGVFCACAELPGERTWDFEAGAEGWSLPAGEGRVTVDLDAPGNSVVVIRTAREHHTKAVLGTGAAGADCLISLRAKILDWEGAPPVVYAYLRRGPEGGLRALQVARDGVKGLCWYGRDVPSLSFGNVPMVRPERPKWFRMVFVCVGEYLAGKAWPEGSPEPGWQVQGCGPGQTTPDIAFGVWTSPNEPSKATVAFDDVTVKPLSRADLATMGLAQLPRMPLAASALAGGSGRMMLPDKAVVWTDTTAIGFDRTTGEIANIVDLASGRELVAPNVPAPLFSCRLRNPQTGDELHTSACDFRKVAFREGASPSAWRIEFSDHFHLALHVHVDVSTRTDGALQFAFSATNLDGWAMPSVSFPQIPATPQLSAEPEKDALLLPWSAGGVLSAPGSRTVRRDAAYPGPAFAQFYAYYGEDCGLYSAIEDAQGHCKRLRLASVAGRSVAVTFQHLQPDVAQTDFRLPYPVVVRTFKGDWYDAADVYRDWAATQPWCAQRLSQRDDIPAFLTEGAGIIIAGIQNAAGRERLLGERLEKLPDLMDAYREATGLRHMVFVPYGWENRGTWAGVNYLPAIPSNEIWREANAALRARGHRTAFLTSGYWWVVRRQKTGSGPAFDDSEDFAQRKDMCVLNRDGSTWHVDNFDVLDRHGSWRGYSVGLCHGSRQAHETLRDTFLEAAGFGVPLISFDQEIGGGQLAPCYHPGHGHPPGYGNWMWTGFRGLCEEILTRGKPVQPELGLFLENVSELAIPYMATYWSRQFGEVDVACGGDRGVGLFSYLYHDYVTAIGAACVQGQGKLGTRGAAELRCAVLANNLVRGLIPGPFMHEVPLDTEGRGEWIGLVSRAYKSYCRPYAPFARYLLLGKRIRSPRIACDSIDAYYWRQDARHGKPQKKGGPPLAKTPLSLASVKAGSFLADDGTVGTVIANVTDATRHVAIDLAPGHAWTLYDATGVELAIPAIDGHSPALDLEPFGVRVLVMREE